eukprot:gnl/TRDRNA2_/TRDRNA2_165822_c0_seq1.p1 gnl/TRDRNA2_/TRDRNA2_165822_c0~~gnl/TRDRNA2_/TRDRNA2_165822_c0_seq1.p1  ORF type:complete len:747 (+),score=86.88 gnl/TRDRNA2_/TRDRNA2_165822_c0_seq1:110-2350(+)
MESPSWMEVCPVLHREREDELWMVTCGVLVVTMNAAFGLVEAGSVQGKNVLNIMMKNMTDLTMGGFIWYLIGYWIAFRRPMAESFPDIYDASHWFFQFTFAATASTIDSGAVAERINFLPYCIISVTTTGFIYPFMAFHVWHSDGYLSQLGFRDFAGGAVVHALGGTLALVGTSILGPRIGRFPNYKPSSHRAVTIICRRPMDPDYYIMPPGQPAIQSVTDPVSLIFGVFFLWVGWYGFNPGSTGGTADANTYVVTRIVVNTTLGAVGGAVCTFVKMMLVDEQVISPDGTAMGVLSGLVTITAGCPWFSNRDAFILGVLGAACAMMTKKALERACIDDVVSAIPIHGAGGLLGTLAIGVCSNPWSCGGAGQPTGILYAVGEDEQQEALRLLAVQCWGCLLIAMFTAACAGTVMCVLNQMSPLFRLRVKRQVELIGIDEIEHAMPHGDLDFQTVIQELVKDIAKSSGNSEDIVEAFRRTNKSLQLDHVMSEEKQKRHEVRSEVAVKINVMSFTGNEISIGSNTASGRFRKSASLASLSSLGQTRPEFSIEVEIVSAPPPKQGDGIWGRTLAVFTKRQTSSMPPTCDTVKWSEDFSFEDFHIEGGREESTYAVFTLCRSGRALAQAHMLVAPESWPAETSSAVEHGKICDQELVFRAPSSDAKCPPEDWRLRVRLAFLHRNHRSFEWPESDEERTEQINTADQRDHVEKEILEGKEREKLLEERVEALERRSRELEQELLRFGIRWHD